MDTDQNKLSDPTVALDWSRLTPELAAALVKAQAASDTIGKDGRNDDANYNYTTAEAIIRSTRKPLTDAGLAFSSSWSQRPSPSKYGQENNADIGWRFIACRVTMHFALVHEGGGVVTGTAEIDAIGSKRTPHDKAAMAALTYMHGFVLRGLLNLDRQEEGDAAVDRRPVEEPEAPQLPQAGTRRVLTERPKPINGGAPKSMTKGTYEALTKWHQLSKASSKTIRAAARVPTSGALTEEEDAVLRVYCETQIATKEPKEASA